LKSVPNAYPALKETGLPQAISPALVANSQH